MLSGGLGCCGGVDAVLACVVFVACFDLCLIVMFSCCGWLICFSGLDWLTGLRPAIVLIGY